MKFKRILASAAAVSLAVAPTMAMAAPAAPVAATESVDGDELAGGGGFIVAIIAAAAIIAGIVIVANEDDEPNSP